MPRTFHMELRKLIRPAHVDHERSSSEQLCERVCGNGARTHNGLRLCVDRPALGRSEEQYDHSAGRLEYDAFSFDCFLPNRRDETATASASLGGRHKR